MVENKNPHKEWKEEIENQFKEIKEKSEEWSEKQQEKLKKHLSATIKPLTELERMKQLWKDYKPLMTEHEEMMHNKASKVSCLFFV